MAKISFSWDKNKESINIKKHKVSFEDAKSVFYDENARVVFDPDHSEYEDRFVIIGLSKKLNILVVSHCYKENEENIRIISARKASKNEIIEYLRFLK
jgi:uncharacterized DUF497 family protein